MNDFLQIIKSRRSTRDFKPEQIKEEELQAILEAGAYAPSAVNGQPWHFTVIQNHHLIDWLSDAFKEVAKTHDNTYIKRFGSNESFHLYYHSPTVILVSGDSKNPSASVDCAAATQNMLLMAESLGIGSCWIGFTAYLLNDGEKGAEYTKELGIPDGYRQIHSIALGYKKNASADAPMRKEGAVNYIR